MKNKWLVILCVFALAAVSLACGASGVPATEVPGDSPAASSTDMSTPLPVVGGDSPTALPAASTPVLPAKGSGLCVGSTAQGYPITVTMVTTDTTVVISRIQFGVQMIGSGWTAESTRVYLPGVLVEDGRFAFNSELPSWEVGIDGTFTGQELEGALWVSHTHPQGLGTAVVTTPYTAVCAYADTR